MKRRPFGKTGLSVGEIGFGAWAIGGAPVLTTPEGIRKPVGFGPTDDNESLAALARFVELGGNLIDTADVYGAGHSEELIGRFLKGRRRTDVVLCTKLGNLPKTDQGGGGQDYSPAYARRAIEASLKRLGTDYVDLYQMHNPAPRWRRSEEVWEGLRQLKKAGKIRHFGVSIGPPEEGFEALALGAEALQVRYNILDQRPRALFWLAARQGVAILTRVPLSSGLLSGKWDAAKKFPEGDHRKGGYAGEKLAEALARVEKLKFLTEGTGRTMLQAALQFALADPAISVTIPGAKRPSQVEENVAAAEAPPLTAAETARIEELWEKEFRPAMGK